MNIAVVYGTERKGCTYEIAKELIGNFNNAKVTEVYLPSDLPEYCLSCFTCFEKEVGKCSHIEYTKPIREKLIDADLIILTSPVYAFHVSGQMKVFLDHFANMWMVHRPQKEMFTKQGVVIATASGPVFKKSLLEMKDSLDFWGVSRTYKMGFALMHTQWEEVNPKIKLKIKKKANTVSNRIKKNHQRTRLSFRVRKWFYLSKWMHKYIAAHEPDVKYWREQGWLDGKKPWISNCKVD